MNGKAYNTYVVKYIPKTHNLDDTCRQIAKEGITYAEWQKRRYRALYDVKSTIKLDISIMMEESFQREYKRLKEGKHDDTVRIFKDCQYRLNKYAPKKEGE